MQNSTFNIQLKKMKTKPLIRHLWIVISLLFTNQLYSQYPTGQEPSVTHYIIGYEYFFDQGEGLQYTAITPTQNFNLNTDIDLFSGKQNMNRVASTCPRTV